MAIPVRDALPVFDRVTICAELVVLSVWLPKLRVVGASAAMGAAGAVPVPVRDAV